MTKRHHFPTSIRDLLISEFPHPRDSKNLTGSDPVNERKSNEVQSSHRYNLIILGARSFGMFLNIFRNL